MPLFSVCSQGTLDLRNKTVADAYTPLNHVFMFDINEKMTKENLSKVCVHPTDLAVDKGTGTSSGIGKRPAYTGDR